MPSLLSSLLNSAGALDAFDQVLAVTQNNVANASTPGYVRQTATLQAMPLDFVAGSSGGVRTGPIESGRDPYADQAVRRQTVALGEAQQNVTSLSALQSLFDISGSSGISGALGKLLNSFSAWAQSPTDTASRQNVISQATALADAFHQTYNALQNSAQDTEGQINATVTQVNSLVGQLQQLNIKILQGARDDPGVDAQVNSTLEQLSQYVEFTAAKQDDGSYSVLMNDQTSLLVGAQAYDLKYQPDRPDAPEYPDTMSTARILSADGRDITSDTTGGQLGALLNVYNQLIPSYIGNASTVGDLNSMAKALAQRVNDILTSGIVADGATPQSGAALFQYDTTNDALAAQSLNVVSTLTPDQLGAIDPGPPEVANGIPLALSNLSQPTQDLDKIQGQSFSAFYGTMAARLGDALNSATSQLQIQQSAVAQAKDLRQQTSGVSLDQEAAVMIQFQRAYEANARFITVLDQLTQDTINILSS